MDVNTLTRFADLRGWHRKPESWEEVGNPVPLELLMELKQFTSQELGIEHDISRGFKKTPEETIFLVGHRGGVYLVRTEGADYARYVRYVGQGIPREIPNADLSSW